MCETAFRTKFGARHLSTTRPDCVDNIKKESHRKMALFLRLGWNRSFAALAYPTNSYGCLHQARFLRPAGPLSQNCQISDSGGSKRTFGEFRRPGGGFLCPRRQRNQNAVFGGAPSARILNRRAKFEWRFPLLPGHWARFLERKLSKELCAKLRFASSGTAWPVPCCFARWCSAGA